MIRLEEFLVAMEYGYLQHEKGHNIQQARINAKKLWEESGPTLKLTEKSGEDPISCKYCDKEFFPEKPEDVYCSEKCQQSDLH